MRRLLPLIALGLLAAAASAQGRIAFETEHHAFDPIDEGDSTSFTFRFTNTGDQPFALLEVRPTCGCTTPAYTTGPVPPGGAGEIVVTYHSKGRPGPFDRAVFVVAEGSEPRAVTLRISGEVRPDFALTGVRQGNVVFETEAWNAPALTAGEGVQHAFRFQVQGERPFRIREARTSADGVEVVFPDRPLFTGDTAAVLVILDDPAAAASPRGRVDVAVTLLTTDEAQPVKSLRVRGRLATGG
jgi:hypothetical protein